MGFAMAFSKVAVEQTNVVKKWIVAAGSSVLKIPPCWTIQFLLFPLRYPTEPASVLLSLEVYKVLRLVRDYSCPYTGLSLSIIEK